eukprot:m51a1_g896 hypothetical protein (209) ;mRNA; r:22700-23326
MDRTASPSYLRASTLSPLRASSAGSRTPLAVRTLPRPRRPSVLEVLAAVDTLSLDDSLPRSAACQTVSAASPAPDAPPRAPPSAAGRCACGLEAALAAERARTRALAAQARALQRVCEEQQLLLAGARDALRHALAEAGAGEGRGEAEGEAEALHARVLELLAENAELRDAAAAAQQQRTSRGNDGDGDDDDDDDDDTRELSVDELGR